MRTKPGAASVLTRRAALAGTAALIAAPALAEECRIGPPPHDRGPAVWMGMDQIELDAAYDQLAYAPLGNPYGPNGRAALELMELA